MRRALLAIVAALVVAAVAAAPASAKHGKKPAGNIVEVAVAASGGGTPDSNLHDYDILIQAVTAAGLADDLQDANTKFTVFAPNDLAFVRLVQDLTGQKPASEQAAFETIAAALTPEQLTDVLLYHVVAGKALSPLQVLFTRRIEMANGGIVRPSWGFRLRDQNDDLRDPRLVLRALDIRASNGVIHTIDRVLIPGAL